ncbi:MAG: hypothetical protein ACTSRA_18605 [Promethearchaeota archaeon]
MKGCETLEKGINNNLPLDGFKSFYVLKNGLPVFHKDYSNSNTGKEESEVVVGGFLSALSSFVKDMVDFGEMKQLETSNNIRFTFYQKDSLLFVACTKGDYLADSEIEDFLKRTSTKFLEMYSKKLANSKIINCKYYEKFESVLTREILAHQIRTETREAWDPSEIRRQVPTLLIPLKDIQHEFYFKGNLPEKILPLIDGKNNIEQISKLSGVEVYKVHAFAKYLIKEGVVRFEKHGNLV